MVQISSHRQHAAFSLKRFFYQGSDKRRQRFLVLVVLSLVVATLMLWNSSNTTIASNLVLMDQKNNPPKTKQKPNHHYKRYSAPNKSLTFTKFWHDKSQTNDYPLCLFTTTGGWGNNVYGLLWSLIFLTAGSVSFGQENINNNNNSTTAVAIQKYPCLDGFYREVLGQLFTNLETCPESQDNMADCFRGFPDQGWPVVKGQVAEYLLWDNPTFAKAAKQAQDKDDMNPTHLQYIRQHYKQTLLQLNQTFVNQILESNCPQLLQKQETHFCGLHVRFGDSFFRKTGEDRICGARELSRQECYDYVMERVQTQMCPNTSTPIYMASDHLEFIQHAKSTKVGKSYEDFYTCSATTSSSTTTSKITHSKDLKTQTRGLASVNDPQIRMLLADWLGLVLAKEKRPGFSSTFRETSGFGFEIVS